MYYRFLIFVVLVLMTGCAVDKNKAVVFIRSSPPGATISDYHSSDRAPVILRWDISEMDKTSKSRPITATWISGASTTVNLNIRFGERQEYTISRPNAPGLEQDIQWAIQLQEAANARSQARDETTRTLLRENAARRAPRSDTSLLESIMGSHGSGVDAARNAAKDAAGNRSVTCTPTALGGYRCE